MSRSKEEEGPLLEGGGRGLASSGGIIGAECVVAPDGGTGGRVVALLWGIGGRVGAGAGGMGDVTLCDRSRMAAFIASRAPWRAGQVSMVWTACWMLPNWVVMVSS